MNRTAQTLEISITLFKFYNFLIEFKWPKKFLNSFFLKIRRKCFVESNKVYNFGRQKKQLSHVAEGVGRGPKNLLRRFEPVRGIQIWIIKNTSFLRSVFCFVEVILVIRFLFFFLLPFFQCYTWAWYVAFLEYVFL